MLLPGIVNLLSYPEQPRYRTDVLPVLLLLCPFIVLRVVVLKYLYNLRGEGLPSTDIG